MEDKNGQQGLNLSQGCGDISVLPGQFVHDYNYTNGKK